MMKQKRSEIGNNFSNAQSYLRRFLLVKTSMSWESGKIRSIVVKNIFAWLTFVYSSLLNEFCALLKNFRKSGCLKATDFKGVLI